MPTRPAQILSAAVVAAALTVCCGGGSSAPLAESAAPAAAPPAPAASPVTAGWKATEGIATPESVYLDEGSGFIFSSQIDGAPDGRDGNGRIAQLSGDGRVISASWVTGLNAPKGLRSHNGTLWTADLDEVIGIDIASAKVTSRTKIAGAMFLNDVAVGPDGTVYVTDMMANKIHAVRDGKASVFAEGEQLEWPNGLLIDGNRLLVGGWGISRSLTSPPTCPAISSRSICRRSRRRSITPKPFANIDGLERDGRGGYIVSDYVAGKILQVSSSGETRELRQFMPGSADIGFVSSGNILLVPHMNENTVASYNLSEVLK